MNECDILIRIENLLYEIINSLNKQDDIIKYGSKVKYKDEIYYYIGYSDGHFVLGDKFLRPLIGVENIEMIKKVGKEE